MSHDATSGCASCTGGRGSHSVIVLAAGDVAEFDTGVPHGVANAGSGGPVEYLRYSSTFEGEVNARRSSAYSRGTAI